MRFRLLGPLAVEGADHPVRLDGRRPRAVLAFLLLEAGALLRVDQIIDAVWGDAPPKTVRTQVHAQISVVRRWLRAVPDARIVTHSTGYALRVPSSALDVGVFRQLTRQGRTLAAAGKPVAAAEAYRAALRLHVGEPLGDIDAPFVRRASVGLADERLAVYADLIGLDLAAGRHHEVVPVLSALVERHPLREPLWCHLLVALDRAGRRGEAIRHYHRARCLLRDELGVEPGPELSSVYRGLLAAGSLATSQIRATAPTPAADRDLERTLSRLAEAERLLVEVRRELSQLGLRAGTARPVNPAAPSVAPRGSGDGAGDTEVAA